MVLRTVTILFFASSVSAFGADCKSIADPTARLSCFDAQKVVGGKVAVDPYGAAKQAILNKLVDPESARWGDFYTVTGEDGGPLICGAVNAKNRMGGYDGMTGFTYEPKASRAILLFSGRTDPDAGIAIRLYRAHCLSDPRADQRAVPGAYIPR